MIMIIITIAIEIVIIVIMIMIRIYSRYCYFLDATTNVCRQQSTFFYVLLSLIREPRSNQKIGVTKRTNMTYWNNS